MSIFDFISLMVIIFALIFVCVRKEHSFSPNILGILVILLILNIFHHLSNFLEWSEIYTELDIYEDYIQILESLFWFFFFFTFIQEFSQKELSKSEKKYRNAYNRAELYKDLFVHDINNILQNFQSSIDLLSLYLKDENLGNQIDNLIRIIKDQTKKGANLVSNIKKLSEIDDFKLITKKIDVIEFIEKAIRKIKKNYKRKKISIQINAHDDVYYVEANDFFFNVINNILLNAVLHNTNLEIKIQIKISKEIVNEARKIKMEFIDNGIGIPNAMKKQIFRKDSQKKNNLSRMGLGLVLIYKIIKKYNGKIWIEDKVKGDYTQGSNFIILMPEAIN
ncbi:MAG: sensor histidine kinase [Promethearchaeota archaeon]